MPVAITKTSSANAPFFGVLPTSTGDNQPAKLFAVPPRGTTKRTKPEVLDGETFDAMSRALFCTLKQKAQEKAQGLAHHGCARSRAVKLQLVGRSY